MGIKLLLKKKLRSLIEYTRCMRKSKYILYEKDYSKHLSLLPLTKREKHIIKIKWGDIVPNISDGYLAYRIYKTIRGFDVNYMPMSYYPWIARYIIAKEYNKAYSHKGMINEIFYNIPQPVMVVNNINGVLFNASREVMDIEEVVEIVLNYKKNLIIKPSIDTSSGKNVQVIKTGINKDDVLKILTSYKKNYVIQEVLEQSVSTSRFNPTSLQTIRVTTLFINNKFYVCNTIMRCGGKGSVVDNFNAGGFMVGINNDGKLNKCGYSLDGKIHSEVEGYVLKECIIPNYEKIKQLAYQAHMQIPMCPLVGWDFALDKNDEPVLIEANLRKPSSFGTQICNGPFFGDCTDEIIECIKSKKLI